MDHWARVEAAITGAEPMGGSITDYRKLFEDDYARWAEVVKVSGAKID